MSPDGKGSISDQGEILQHPAIVALIFVVAILLPASGMAGDGPLERVDQAQPDEHALWLGKRILAIAEAIDSPETPGAMEVVLALGSDSRYYVMVRGWLAMQLAGDLSIMESHQGDVSPQITARIAFLRKAIRAIDLE